MTDKTADTLFSEWIRERDRTCFFCNQLASDCSHYFERGHSSTRYDPENCDGACRICHDAHGGKKNGLYRKLKIEQMGLKRFEALERRANSIMKRSEAVERFIKWYKVNKFL